MTEPDLRLTALTRWITGLDIHGADPGSLRPASSDASFRRYFRLDTSGGSRIVMDAPPPAEDTAPFIHAASVLAAAGVEVPEILASDTEQGFLLLSDLGSTTFLTRLQARPQDADALYAAASRQLVRLQVASAPGVFDDYDRARLLAELRLFDQWYLQAHRRAELSAPQQQSLLALYDVLLANNLAQPRVFVHRDWHSRNLMILGAASDAAPEIAVLDFQDALYGPITYDLVSLLRDAYVDWPEERVLDWAVRHWEASRAAGLPVHHDFGDFYRDFEWMGLQRHLKVLGIFARLALRDQKPVYIDDMPRVLAYVLAVSRRYREFAPLFALLRRIEGEPLKAAFTF